MPDYTVYCHISPSKKVYVGITMQEPKRRWENGKGYKESPVFYKAIKKYGWDNFQHFILKTGLTKEEAEAEEIRLIAAFNSTDRDHGYNIENGGNTNGTHSEETKQKIADGNKGKKVSEESLKRMRAAHKGKQIGDENPFWGRHHTDEVKRKQSEIMRGNDYFKGKHHTEEFKRRKSEQMKEKYWNGKNPFCKALLRIENGVVIAKYNSLTDAAKNIGVSRGWLCTNIKRNRECCGAFWRYEQE